MSSFSVSFSLSGRVTQLLFFRIKSLSEIDIHMVYEILKQNQDQVLEILDDKKRAEK